MGFKIKQPGKGPASLPAKEAVIAPKTVSPAKPVSTPKPARKEKPKAVTSEAATVQFVFYMTPTEAKSFKDMLDGRPVSSFVRKKIAKLLGDNNGI